MIVIDALGRPVPAPGLARWLARVAPRLAAGEVSVALVSDRRVRALNRRYRDKDAMTDVLAFPVRGAPTARSRSGLHPGEAAGHALGDIVIATGQARRQSRALGHTYAAELRVLALHGLLHLLGYDHAWDGGGMERLEQRLRRKGGLPSGLLERATRVAGGARTDRGTRAAGARLAL